MDSSRFKRRETNTQRPIVIDTARRPSMPVRPIGAEYAARPAAPVAPAAPAYVQPQPQLQPQPALINPAEAARMPEPQQPRARIDMGLPGEESPTARTLRVIRSKWIAVRRWGFRGAAVGVVLVIGVSGFLFSQGLFKAKKVFSGTQSAASLQENVDPTLLKGEGDGRINVLLLGRGGAGHEAPDLTDTLLIASIDPVNKTSTLLSLPRDFYVKAGNSNMKVNAVWANGKYGVDDRIGNVTNTKAVQAGFAAIDQSVEEIIGIPIHYNVMVDFKAFKQAIDTVDGVAVNVSEDLIDPTIAWENGGNSVIARAGLQQFNGDQALLFARSRQTSNDFARGERQRALLLGLKDKSKSLGTLSNPVKLSGLINAFGNNVSTDLSLSDASRLFTIVKDIDNASISSIGLTDKGINLVTTANIGGQSVVQPRAGQFTYTAIQNFVRAQIKDPYLLQEKAKILVLNGTATPGLAAKKAETLTSYGYTVSGTGNTPAPSYTTTTIIDMGTGKKYTKNYLEQRFGKTATTTLPDPSIQANGADFVIIVGSDEATTNQG